MLQAIAGPDPADGGSIGVKIPNYRSGLHKGIKGMRIGVLRHVWEEDVRQNDEVVRAMDAAIGVLKSLHEQGIRIPEEVVVVGFDDLGFAPCLNPPLTTVRAPTEKVGQLATERLFGLLEDQPTKEVLILPTEIIFRRSCGCEN